MRSTAGSGARSQLTSRAVTGIALGLVAVVATVAIVWTFHDLIWRVLHEINANPGG